MTQGIQTNRHTAQPMPVSGDPAEAISNMDSQGIVAPPPKPPAPSDVPEKKSTGMVQQPDSTSIQEESEATSTGLPSLEEIELEEQLQAKFAQDKAKAGDEGEVPDFNFELPDDENAKKFREAFNKYLGFDVDELKNYAQDYRQAIDTIRTIQQENYVRESVNNLSMDWGVSQDEANARLEEVRQRFASYSPEMQARLDNVEGAKLIWSRIENEALRKQRNVPTFNSSTRTTPRTSTNQRMFTQAQIDAMSAREYSDNYSDILFAYQNGLVK